MGKDKTIYIGAAYYPEAWDDALIDEDIAKMHEAHMNVMRIGEFSWSTMEREEGKFDFSLFSKVMDKLHAAGISVVLCTPSATPPKWLTDKYEETLTMKEDGRRKQFGGRCHPCKSSPVMREKNRIIVTKMCQALASHPSVIGWQIDNEIYPYDNGCFCPLCRKGFSGWLKKKYGTIDALNKQWGAARWSLHYKDFDDVIPPRSDTWCHPSLKIEWIRFHSDNITEYVNEQAAIIKKYSSAPVGTDMMPLMEQNYYKTNERLDVVQFNHYEPWYRLEHPSFWFDFVRAVKPSVPFWNTETQACWPGSEWSTYGYRPKGNCYINTWLPIAKGGEMNMYWLWRAHYAGHELAHGAVLSSSGRFNYTKDETVQAAKEFEKCGELLHANPVKSEIAMHYSATAWLNFKFAPLSEKMNYLEFLMENFHRPLRHYNVDLIDTPHGLEGYKLLVSPYLSCVDEHGLKERVIEWVKGGGVWIVGPMSDIMADNASKYTNAPYSFLEELAGIYTSFQLPIPSDEIKAKWADGSDMQCGQVFDGFELRGAKALATYSEGHPKGLAAVTCKKVGKGKVIVLGTMLAPADFRRLVERELGFTPIAKATGNVELVGRGELIIAIELNNEHGNLTLQGRYRDVIRDEICENTVEILPYTVKLLEPIK